MIRTTAKIKKLGNIPLEIAVANLSVAFVKKGDKVKAGDELFAATNSIIVESHYLPKALGIRPDQGEDHVGRVSGQYVVKGDLLAERLTTGGLITKRVVAGQDGVVSTARLKEGYLDILSESEDIIVKSGVSGRVLDVNAFKSILIECEGWGIEYHSDRNLGADENEQGYITGELEVIGDGKSVYTVKNLNENYENKIVFAGRFLHPEVARELYKRNCKAIIVYSIEYEQMRDLGVPIIVLGGFGAISTEMEFYNELLAVEKQTIQIHRASKMIIIHGEMANGKTEKAVEIKTSLDGYAPYAKKGQQIRSYEQENYGQIGRINELSTETDSVIATRDDKTPLVAMAENIEIISIL